MRSRKHSTGETGLRAQAEDRVVAEADLDLGILCSGHGVIFVDGITRCQAAYGLIAALGRDITGQLGDFTDRGQGLGHAGQQHCRDQAWCQ
ncbi:MAG: hypothetical protein U5P41_00935 [Gammaproteobacteria bacterium]|nr:hypothetical protein [Gammaproteobacteria bacterium]